MTGKKHSELTKKKMSLASIGRKKSLEARKKMSISKKGCIPWNKGKKNVYSLETIREMSNAKKGQKSNLWKGGITPVNTMIRASLEYKLWRKSVFERDNYICIWCGQKGGKLSVDHIKPFALYPELRFAIDNGRTLCIDCHRKTDTWGSVRIK